MALVFITYHDENIGDIEQLLQERTPDQINSDYMRKNATKYRHPKPVIKKNFQRLENGNVLVNYSQKYDHKTMGEAPKCTAQAPCNFLRKSGGVKWLREARHKCVQGAGAPPLPKYTPHKKKDCPPANMIERNIDKCRKAEVKRPRPLYVDTAKGNRQELINSGMIPQYICGKGYGKVPKYVKIYKKQYLDFKERCLKQQDKEEVGCLQQVDSSARKLTDEERRQILAGLQANFNEMNRNYQSMSLYTDTIAKNMRKSRLEKALTQVEKDIIMLENHPVIYVSQVE